MSNREPNASHEGHLSLAATLAAASNPAGSDGSPRRVSILGSTGSIGTQALDIIANHRDRFHLVALSATGSSQQSVDALIAQAKAFAPEVVAVADIAGGAKVRDALVDAGIDVAVGETAAADTAAREVDVVLNAMAGAAGLQPSLAALAAGATLAIANKESLVAGGALVRANCRPGQLVPVDSEHSALAQCLTAGTRSEIQRLILTASGGAFRTFSAEQLETVTVEQALKHPNWVMGPLVTINSATMVNKGLEVIEAHVLFGIDYDRIEVVVHPQQLIHSMVEFVDGSTIAQASPPDMHLPIALGLAWPHRLAGVSPQIDWTRAHTWEFWPLDDTRFPAVSLAVAAGRAGGTHPAVFNAANEAAVAAFTDGRLAFTGIVPAIERALAAHRGISDAVVTLDAVLDADAWARSFVADSLARG